MESYVLFAVIRNTYIRMKCIDDVIGLSCFKMIQEDTNVQADSRMVHFSIIFVFIKKFTLRKQ